MNNNEILTRNIRVIYTDGLTRVIETLDTQVAEVLAALKSNTRIKTAYTI